MDGDECAATGPPLLECMTERINSEGRRKEGQRRDFEGAGLEDN